MHTDMHRKGVAFGVVLPVASRVRTRAYRARRDTDSNVNYTLGSFQIQMRISMVKCEGFLKRL